ncbi:hypothetical protein [Actinomadura parmotrematis]|uniref:Uncharacterized protein n=1 Tax=Actinomadura parmotrematis TaxID=2864039 RepID=A0ABS7FXD5_9ACTN|nr:hypothetical protein [Actinomadura parmotrematis]MBW8485092.1 hypothetical protein [Actinomadura parmotrematis]
MTNPPPPPGWDPPGGSTWPPPGQGPTPGGPPPGQGFGGQATPPPGQGFGGGGTPPPFYPPPGGQPGPGMYGAPPPKKSGSGALIALLVGGAVVIVLLLVVVVVVVASGGKSATEKMRTAALTVSNARTITYKGTLSSGTDSLQGDTTVTKSGRAGGAVSWSGSNVTLLTADGKTFVKADSTYWKTKLSSSSSTYFLSGQQWGRLSSTDLTVDFKQLTPAMVASKMRQAVTLRVKPTKATLQGRKALKFTSALSTFYITDEDSPKLLRYESSYPRVSADTEVKDTAAGASDVSTLRSQAGELRDSFDSSVRPTVSEYTHKLCNANSSSCRVRGKVRVLLGSGGPVKVEVRYSLTGSSYTGKDLGSCTTSVTVSGSDGTWAECSVRSSEWAAFSRGSTSTYYQHSDFKVTGISDSELSSLQSGFDQD